MTLTEAQGMGSAEVDEGLVVVSDPEGFKEVFQEAFGRAHEERDGSHTLYREYADSDDNPIPAMSLRALDDEHVVRIFSGKTDSIFTVHEGRFYMYPYTEEVSDEVRRKIFHTSAHDITNDLVSLDSIGKLLQRGKGLQERQLGLVPEEEKSRYLIPDAYGAAEYVELFDEIVPGPGDEEVMFDGVGNKMVLTHRDGVRSVLHVRKHSKRGLVVEGEAYNVIESADGFYGEVHEFKHIVGTKRIKSFNVRPFEEQDYQQVFGDSNTESSAELTTA